jgi:hypothetical protein
MNIITPSTILMVKPQHFGYNPETAATNSFQQTLDIEDASITENAIAEYDKAIEKIRTQGIEVLSYEADQKEITPDAVFPNNWIGFHPGGKVFLYPMTHENRRKERDPEILKFLTNSGHQFSEVIDLSENENSDLFLEGTGSMVFDFKNKKVYGCVSPRTSIKLFNEVAESLGVTPISFSAIDLQGKQIYHTNVILTITEKIAIICMDAIENLMERTIVKMHLEDSGLEIISISYDQVNQFAGNLFEVKNKAGVSYLIGSESAWGAFTKEQLEIIQKYHQPIKLAIPTIEKVGGGSARCMMAGVYF